ncbi:hypothetical protein D9M73_114550 [compost metagenome]
MRKLGRLHAVVIGIEAADQPAPCCQDLAAVERDRNRLVGDGLATGVERDEAQPQIVLLHQPAIGLNAQLHGAREDRDAFGRGQHFAIGVLIIHFDQHVGDAVERLRNGDGLFASPVATERGWQGLRWRERGLLLLAIAIERLGALGDHLAAEAVTFIAVGLGVMREIADAHVDRQVRCAAARQIADEQIEQQIGGADRGVLGAGDARAHCRQFIFVDLEGLRGFYAAAIDDYRQVVIAHWRAGRGGPFILANAIGVDRQRQIELRIGPAMLQAQRAGHRRGHAEAIGNRRAQDVLHVDRLALADEHPVEHGVQHFAARLIAIGQVEVIGADAFAPCCQREAEIVGGACGNHQRMAAGAFATAPGLGFGQARRGIDAAALVGHPARQHLAGAAIAHAHFGPGDGFAGVERGHPGEAFGAAPFEVDAHIGDERGGGDIARGLAPQQGLAEHWARQFDDIETGLAAAERHADDFEILALAG